MPIEDDIDIFLSIECHAERFADVHIVERWTRGIEHNIARTQVDACQQFVMQWLCRIGETLDRIDARNVYLTRLIQPLTFPGVQQDNDVGNARRAEIKILVGFIDFTLEARPFYKFIRTGTIWRAIPFLTAFHVGFIHDKSRGKG